MAVPEVGEGGAEAIEGAVGSVCLSTRPVCPSKELPDEGSDPATALKASAQLMQAHPDLNMMIGIDATAGKGIGQALKEAGLAGKILAGAMDRDDDMLPYIKDGIISYSMGQNSTMEEWVAMHYLYWLVHNTIPAFAEDWRKVGAPQCPWLTNTGVTPITKQNVDYFFHKTP